MSNPTISPVPLRETPFTSGLFDASVRWLMRLDQRTDPTRAPAVTVHSSRGYVYAGVQRLAQDARGRTLGYMDLGTGLLVSEAQAARGLRTDGFYGVDATYYHPGASTYITVWRVGLSTLRVLVHVVRGVSPGYGQYSGELVFQRANVRAVRTLPSTHPDVVALLQELRVQHAPAAIGSGTITLDGANYVQWAVTAEAGGDTAVFEVEWEDTAHWVAGLEAAVVPAARVVPPRIPAAQVLAVPVAVQQLKTLVPRVSATDGLWPRRLPEKTPPSLPPPAAVQNVRAVSSGRARMHVVGATRAGATPTGLAFIGVDKAGVAVPQTTEALVLRARDLPAHEEIVIQFEFMVIGGWYGDGGGSVPPSRFIAEALFGDTTVTVADMSIATVRGYTQSLPDRYATAEHARNAGAAEINTLGYAQDALYRIRIRLSAEDRDITLRLRAEGLTDGAAWALSRAIIGVVAEKLAEYLYRATFIEHAGPEWSATDLARTPAGRRGLGTFGNESVQLTLQDLPAHTHLRLHARLAIIGPWNGAAGPATWGILEDANVLAHTTFSNTADVQSWPGPYPGDLYTARSGAIERNSLGYGGDTDTWPHGDSVYWFELAFAHTGDTLTLTFYGQDLPADAVWLLDDIRLSLADDIEASSAAPTGSEYGSSSGYTECPAYPRVVGPRTAMGGTHAYARDFTLGADANWSATAVATVGGEPYLGPNGNDRVRFALADLPPHTHLDIMFDLFILGEWTGNTDDHRLVVSSEQGYDRHVLLDATFSNFNCTTVAHAQSYPDARGANNPGYTGAAEIDTLSRPSSIYRIHARIPHTIDTLTLVFEGRNLGADVVWGIAKLVVDAETLMDVDTAGCPTPVRTDTEVDTDLSAFPGIILDRRHLHADIRGSLYFVNRDTAVTVSTADDGHTLLQFPVHGSAEDVATFWRLVDEAGRRDGRTLAQAMDRRVGVQTTQPTAEHLPTTLNPMRVLLAHALGGGVILARVAGHAALRLPPAALRALPRAVSPNTVLILQTEIERESRGGVGSNTAIDALDVIAVEDALRATLNTSLRVDNTLESTLSDAGEAVGPTVYYDLHSAGMDEQTAEEAEDGTTRTSDPVAAATLWPWWDHSGSPFVFVQRGPTPYRLSLLIWPPDDPTERHTLSLWLYRGCITRVYADDPALTVEAVLEDRVVLSFSGDSTLTRPIELGIAWVERRCSVRSGAITVGTME